MESQAGSSTGSQPTRSLNKQVVLEEDEYTEAMSHIIARDFFPSLVHLDATNEYLDALRAEDTQRIDASVRRLESLTTPIGRSTRVWQTPSRTPFGAGPSDTPLRTPREEPPEKRPRYDTNMTLDTFQARYTSEDNASFTQILEDENRRRKEKYKWAWEAQKRVEQQRDRMIEAREKMLIEAPAGTGVREKFRIEAPTPAGLLTDGSEVGSGAADENDRKSEGGDEPTSSKGKEVVVRDAGGEVEDKPVDVMAPRKDTRSAGVDGWEFRARNALMFAPDADESPYHPKPAVTAADAKPPPPKIIKYNNTRLAEQEDVPSGSLDEPPSPTRSRIDAAIAGTPYRPKSPTTNNFSLVPSMPSPTPSELGPAAVKQLMTWGTLNATPRVLSQPDDPAESIEMPPPNTFQIRPPSARDRIAQKLSVNAAKSLRAKAELLGIPGLRTPSTVRRSTQGTARQGSMPPPAWTPRRAEGGLTPAAKRLLDRTTMSTAAARRADAMGRAAGWEGQSKAKEQDLNRVRWTPTPTSVTRKG
ncbi:hypothetical protein NM688_g6653 [Phlebia brevispora]|uniref:Uncharacterized protein n=1 Tax=Phlebia brevispora TaxID=194682 RepID=A0ACC1SE40_9APHY|nr:hypothetical protein NM688_g6653 [Phlebia brevispora]